MAELPENKLTDFIKSSEKAKWIPVNNHNINSFTEDEIKRITNSYSTVIGKGGFGQVYKGVLDDGTPVAVKKYVRQNLTDGFGKEIIVHCQINHKNVVRLLGCCMEENAFVIVTEYVSGGNLGDLLHGSEDPISLDERLRIAIQCADALGYMHSSMYQPIIHGDIKPDNILLDNKLGAKLADFGLSRLLCMDKTQYTMIVSGSIGYIDPEYIETGIVHPKSDVYSFGVVLLELITRAKASESGFSIPLKRSFTDALRKGKKEARKMFDSEIAHDKYTKILDGIGNLAAECFTKDIKERPEMKNVQERLQLLRSSLHREQAQEKLGQKSSILDIFSRNARRKHFERIGGLILQGTSGVTSNSVKPQNETSMSHAPAGGGSYPQTTLQLENWNHRFTYEELEIITNNFLRVLGRGSFGYVYDGFLEDGTRVAVKLRSDSSNQGVKEFVAEAQTLTRIHHKCLMSMIGYCNDGDHMALVYEYMSEGTLQEHISGNGRNTGFLSWRQRLYIALESAQGLEYLHVGRNPPFIHKDVKTANILLSAKLEAKIADFGLTKAYRDNDTHVLSTSTLVGTPGYVDPEYHATMQPTTKSDVYSFGVVLLELVTGRPAILRDPEPMSIIQWASLRLSQGNIESVADPRMRGDYDVNSMWKTADVALKCTAQASVQRPAMTAVVWQLKECLELDVARADGGGDANGGATTPAAAGSSATRTRVTMRTPVMATPSSHRQPEPDQHRVSGGAQFREGPNNADQSCCTLKRSHDCRDQAKQKYGATTTTTKLCIC